MKIAISQLEIVPFMPSDNASRIINYINIAKDKNVDMIIFPELCLSGYFIGDMLESKSFLEECKYFGEEVIKASNGIFVIFGNVAYDENKKNFDGSIRKYNAMFIAKDSKLLNNNTTSYPYIIKTLLPNYGEFEDSRYFYSLIDFALENNISIKEYLKPLKIECNNGDKINLGLTISEDICSENYSISPIDIINKNKDVDIFINIASSPYSLIKNYKKHKIYAEIANKHNVNFIYVNNVGIQNNGNTVYTFDGGSSVYDNNGKLLILGKRYESELYYIDIKNKKFPTHIETKD